jgi:glycosyltransferase involved in cell wall biosynthesis
MKIAFMAYDRPSYYAGPITNARRLLPELQKRGHDVHAMIFFDFDSPTAQYLQSHGVTCHYIQKPRHTETQISWILRTLKKINPDVFIPNIFVSGWYAAKWVQQANIPAIAAYRSDDSYYWAMVREFVVGAPEWAVDGLVCVSQHLKEKVEALHPTHTQLCMIPSGVPVPDYYSQQSESLSLVYIGRLVQQQKRIRETFDALVQVIRGNSDIRATLIGEGSEEAYLKQKIQALHLGDRIELSCAIPNDKLHQELRKHNVLVLLSDYEGTPGAVMDGMACGLVPVCLDIGGGVSELVIPGKTGILVRDRDKSFIDAIQQLKSNRALRVRLSQNARQHIIDYYSLDVATSLWETFFEQLIDRTRLKKQISIPWCYKLPHAKPGLAHDDHRLNDAVGKMIRRFSFIRCHTK